MGLLVVGVQMRARVPRGLVVGVCGASLLLPDVAIAAPSPDAAKPDMAAVQAGHRRAKAAFASGDYAGAIKEWTDAVRLMPETAEHKDNRTTFHGRIAEAYRLEFERLQGDENRAARKAAAREALATLDGYVEQYAAAYRGESVSAAIAETRDQARAIVEEPEPEPDPVLVPEPDKPTVPQPTRVKPPPPAKPWKPFAAAGGVSLGIGVAMLAVFGVGLARSKEYQGQFDDPMNDCDLDNIVGKCAEIDSQGHASNKLTIAGVVTAPLFLGAGAALMVVAFKRKSRSTRTVAPVWNPRMAGVVFEQRF